MQKLKKVFLSTFPRRERPYLGGVREHTEYFYPRSHVGNDTLINTLRTAAMEFLSTFPRRERLHDLIYSLCLSLFLSTFPRRERLYFLRHIRRRRLYFYPRSHVGNDLVPSKRCRITRYFYPRSHVGNDSIGRRVEFVQFNFYPRSHVGNDSALEGKPSVLMIFLSTFPRRERLDSIVDDIANCDFYPRSHVGND